MRKINFPPPAVARERLTSIPPPRHWSETETEHLERTLNVVPIFSNGDFHYLITSGHWADLLKCRPENRLTCLFPPELNGQATLAHCTSYEAALAAFRLLGDEP